MQRAPFPGNPPQRIAGMLGTFALHVLAVFVLMRAVPSVIHPPSRESVVTIRLLPEVQRGAIQLMAAPRPELDKPQPQPPPRPVDDASKKPPLPKPAPPKPALKPAPRPQAPKAARTPVPEREPLAASPAPVPKAGEQVEQETESLLDRLRANWLEPPRAAKNFRCKLRIDYRARGVITGVSINEGCSDRMLADSVERAVWKTQPLPLSRTDPPEGHIDLEFSP